MDTGDRFRDSIAFARSVLRDDLDAMDAILNLQENVLDLLIPMSWLLNAAVGRLSTDAGVSIDDIWMVMLDSVERVDQGLDEDEDES